MYFHSIILILDDPCISCVPVSLSGSKGMDSISTTSRVRFKNIQKPHLQDSLPAVAPWAAVKSSASALDVHKRERSWPQVLTVSPRSPKWQCKWSCRLAQFTGPTKRWSLHYLDSISGFITIQGLEMSSAKQIVCVAPNHWACSYVWIAVKACWGYI